MLTAMGRRYGFQQNACKPGLAGSPPTEACATPALPRISGSFLLAGMKVSFTPKEYGRLLELAHLGLWVAGSRPDDPATMPERYGDLARKVFALAEPLGCADLINTDVNGQMYPSEKLTTGPTQEKLDQFLEDTFWSELVGRLAERDLRAELGPTKLSAELTAEESTRLDAMEDRYWREFEQSGVDHLVLLRGGRG
jgi:hypothetical protein